VALGLVAIASLLVVAGCSKVEDRPVVRITDNDGTVPARTITVGYVNERLDRMPTGLIPDVAGDEGKKQFLEDIIRKELMVVQGLRLGLDKDPRQETARGYFEKSKAEEMLQAELIDKPSEVTPEELQAYYAVRDVKFQLLEIVTTTKEAADAAYKRVTEAGEDFSRVAGEVSASSTATDGGSLPVTSWQDMHPLARVAVKDLDKGAITPPIEIGGTFTVYKVLSRKAPAEQKPLEGQHLKGIEVEAKAFKRGLKEHELVGQWMAEANPTYDPEGLKIAGQRTDEMVAKLLPKTDAPTSFEARMERARMQIVPEFTDEEKTKPLLTYKIGGEDKAMTLGDYQALVQETPGMETPKGGEEGRLKGFILRKVQQDIVAYEVEKRGYKNTQEMKDYLTERAEELLVEMTYDAEVVQKVPEPTGEEIKEYFRSHRADFSRPPYVDLQQLIVGTEAEANQIRQQLVAGQAKFVDLVKKHSIDEWSKAKDGIIKEYYQGERRLSYLQEPAFRLAEGEISEPVRAPGGYAIIRVLKKYPERLMDFDEVGEVVKQTVVTAAREERLMQLLDEIRGTVTIETIEKNLQHVKDPAEVLKLKKEENVTVTKSLGGE